MGMMMMVMVIMKMLIFMIYKTLFKIEFTYVSHYGSKNVTPRRMLKKCFLIAQMNRQINSFQNMQNMQRAQLVNPEGHKTTNWVFRLFSYFYSNRVRSCAINLTLTTLIDKVIPLVDVGFGGFWTMSAQSLNMNYCKADCISDNTNFFCLTLCLV